MKAKPHRIVRVNASGDIDDLFSLYCRFKKPNPVPTRRLKLGPAKQPWKMRVSWFMKRGEYFMLVQSACKGNQMKQQH